MPTLRLPVIAILTAALCILSLTEAFANAKHQAWLDRKLLIECHLGDVPDARLLLAEGANPNARDPETDSTPLIEAVSSHDSGEIITLLVKYGAKLEARDGDGMTALAWAAFRSDLRAVEALTSLGASVNARDDNGETPLFELHGDHSFEIAKVLLAHHADPKAKDKNGEQPILNAEDIPCVQLLLDHGANINAQDNGGVTLLETTGGPPDLIKYLLDHGADPNIRDGDGVPAWMGHLYSASELKVFLDYGVDVNMRDGKGRTALLQAASESDTDVIALLIAHGADVNARTPRADTAYTLAAHRDDYDRDDIIALLVKAGEKDARPIPKMPAILLSAQSDEALVARTLIGDPPGGRGYIVVQQDSLTGRAAAREVPPSLREIPAGLLRQFRMIRGPSKVYPPITNMESVKSVRECDIMAVFKDRGTWADFYKRFPGSSGLCTMSLPVFDKDHKNALIYASFQSGDLSGSGNLYLLRRNHDGWTVIEQVLVWIH